MHEIDWSYRKILNAMSECAGVLSSDAQFLYANLPLCDFFNQTPQQIKDKKLFDFFPENAVKNLQHLLDSAKTRMNETELNLIDKNGHSLLIHLKLLPIFENQITVRFVLLITNINEYTLAIQSLEEEKFFLAQAQILAKIGNWETDLSDFSATWSDETHKIFETDSSVFSPTHQSFLDLVHPDDRITVNLAFISSLSQKSEQVLEHRLLLKDGKVKYIEKRWKVFFDEDDLPIRVFGVCQDISERKISEEKIQYYAFYDSLTNLPNRLLLLDRLQNMHSSSIRRTNCDAVIFIDLDHFKELNDTQGHDVGDLLLVETAKRLNLSVRKSDTIGRLGGDEFIVIMQDLDVEVVRAAVDAERLAKAILNSLSEPYDFNGQQYFGTASIGISLFCNQEISVTELLKRADAAMYQAKNAGGNTFRFYDPAMQSALKKKRTLDFDMRSAIKNEQFQLFYQMQVDHFNHIQSAEALIRWSHPKLGMISPTQFIPLAEETALIIPIGNWVLSSACLQIKAWENNPSTQNLRISVNVSARQFHQTDFVEQVIQTIKSHDINPAKLKLELTESLVLNNIVETISKMHDLKKFGILFSLDDFGTGYSSLSYLTKLPLDELKIDQSFVQNIFENEKDKIVVQTIIGMAQNLGIKVIAEGVETEIQKSFLEYHGCSLFQGYLYGKPVPIDVFENYMQIH